MTFLRPHSLTSSMIYACFAQLKMQRKVSLLRTIEPKQRSILFQTHGRGWIYRSRAPSQWTVNEGRGTER